MVISLVESKSMAALSSLKVSVDPFPSHILADVLGHCGTDERGAGREYDLLLLSVFASDFYDGRQIAAWYAPYSGDCHVAFFIAPRHWNCSPVASGERILVSDFRSLQPPANNYFLILTPAVLRFTLSFYGPLVHLIALPDR